MGLNTDHLEVRPLTDKEKELMIHVLMAKVDDSKDWVFDPLSPFDPDIEERRIEIPWILRLIRQRIIAENLKIEITKKAYLLILIFADTPAKAMYLLHKAGNFFEKNKAKRWLLTAPIFTMDLFPDGFPTEASFNQWWDNQKVESEGQILNLVDFFPNEWKK